MAKAAALEHVLEQKQGQKQEQGQEQGQAQAQAQAQARARAQERTQGATQERAQTAVAFLGNSILYYNDTPRLVEALGSGSIAQDSCLRGGVTFAQLLRDGNGMAAWSK